MDRGRREFLRGTATAGALICGVSATAAGRGKPDTDPSVTFPNQTALVLPDNPAPMEAAVETRDVHMPEGGWVVITWDDRGDQPVGRSMRRLPAGHFQNLKVAVKALPATDHDLTARLLREGDNLPDPAPEDFYPVADSASVTFPATE